MIHPGLEHEKASELTEEQCHKKISEINIRIGIAHQLGRTDALPQLRSLVEHYQAILKDKMDAELQEMIDNDPKLGRTVIDIDWPDPADEKDDEEF